MTRETIKTCAYWLVLGLILAVGIRLRCNDFFHDVDNFLFRETHVASNIYFFLRDGLSFTTNMFTKNTDYVVFDFPLYQQIVAVISKMFGVPFVQTGRGVNIGIYIATYGVLLQLMRCCRSQRLTTIVTLLFFSISPLAVLYHRGILPDNLAILCGFISLLFFLKWQTDSSARLYSFVMMTISGVIATLIKNPIYLPIVITMLFWHIIRRKERSPFSPANGLFFLSIGATVVLFKLYTNYMNVGTFETPDWEFFWYFSNLSERLKPVTYSRILNRIFLEIASPSVCMFAFLGAWQYLVAWKKQTEQIIMTGLTIGAFITVLIFLNVNSLHNYYQLPYIFIVCFFAAHAVERCYESIEQLLVGYTPRIRWTLQMLFIVTLLIFLLHTTRFYMLPRNEPQVLIKAGEFIRTHTPQDTFVLYLIKNDTFWFPEYLYFAKRDGYNVGANQLTETLIRQLSERYGNAYETMYFYVPENLLNLYKTTMPDSGALVSSASESGSLFLLKPKAAL